MHVRRNHVLDQRFSNWGPRTKAGPRRVPMGSARGFPKVVIVCTIFNNLRPICFQICKHKSVNQSQCIAWKCCRGFGTTGFLLMSLSSAARDLLTTLMIGSSLLREMMLWLSVSVILKNKAALKVKSKVFPILVTERWARS